eukprot:TRINITY_DN11537_c0_g2_i2.p1 TRINITY_DN11537_c0_g2~~TRINITY_DN11537_c0_g2_i2.p1  ORF type:complete len:306 (+),score=20.91 TRINITY_DN11537_c0_g2_i2:142-1059(+)
MQAPVFALLTGVIALAKILFTSIVLISHSGYSCNGWELEIWLITMLIHDLMNIFAQILWKYAEELQRERDASALSVSYDEFQEGLDSLALDFHVSSSLTRIERIRKAVRALTLAIHLLFIVLFTWGHFIYFNDRQCSVLSPKEYLLLSVFLLLGYIYFLGILCLVIIFAVCFILFLIILSFFNSPAIQPTPAEVLDSLPTFPYDSRLFTDHTMCVICRNDYVAEEVLMRLPCNPSHYFHERCIRTWLGTNGTCPICRKRIDGAEEFSQTEVSLLRPYDSRWNLASHMDFEGGEQHVRRNEEGRFN